MSSSPQHEGVNTSMPWVLLPLVNVAKMSSLVQLHSVFLNMKDYRKLNSVVLFSIQFLSLQFMHEKFTQKPKNLDKLFLNLLSSIFLLTLCYCKKCDSGVIIDSQTQSWLL
jgi:hypothetical protein